MAMTGNGATFAGSTTTTVFEIVEINAGSQSISDLDVSTLAQTTTFKKSMSGDLAETNEVEVTVNWISTATPPAIGGTPETWTLTFPKEGTATTAKSLTGTGYCKSVGYPTFQNDNIAQGSVVVKFDGVTGPTYS